MRRQPLGPGVRIEEGAVDALGCRADHAMKLNGVGGHDLILAGRGQPSVNHDERPRAISTRPPWGLSILGQTPAVIRSYDRCLTHKDIPVQSDAISGVLLPLILAFIMFSLGLGLSLNDFRHILRQPKALIVGVICHFILLPLVAFGLVTAAGLTGAFAVGFILVAACPTGSTSNLLTYIARGDVALAVSFTAIASVLTIFTLPVVVTLAMSHFAVGSMAVEVPVTMVMANVFLLLGLPVALGMLWRGLQPARAIRFEGVATKISTVLFILIVAVAVAKNWPLVASSVGQLAPVALALNVTMLLVGFALAWMAQLSRRQSVTLGIESAMQNATLALVIATSVLKSDAMAIPGAVYGVLMYVGGLAFAYGMRRFTA
ncbi:MAG: bile acid:sodium symporter family protein, partial [Rubrivivax sp.]